MFMIIEANKGFSFDEKSKMDANNPKVQEWEELMWKFSTSFAFCKVWREMDAYGKNI